MDRERMLELALEALEKQRTSVEDEIRELTGQLEPGITAPSGKRRTRTAAERRAHSQAMKLYWRRRKAAATKAKSKSGPQSAAARKAVSERMRAYWAKRKAQAAKAPGSKRSR